MRSKTRHSPRCCLVFPVLLSWVLGCTSAPAPQEAEETLERIAHYLDEEESGWTRWDPGSWVELRTSYAPEGQKESESWFRTTLVSRTADAEVQELESLAPVISADGRQTFQPTGYSRSYTRPASRYEQVTELRRERVTVGAAEIECRVLGATLVTPCGGASAGATEARATMTIWITTDPSLVPRVLRKSGSGSWWVEGGTISGTVTMTVVERDLSREVQGRRLHEWRVRREWLAEDRSNSYLSDIVCSDDVPGILVHAWMRSVFTWDGKESSYVSVNELTAFKALPRAQPPEPAPTGRRRSR